MTDPFGSDSGSTDFEMDRELAGYLSAKSVALKFPKVGHRDGGTILSFQMRDDMKKGERQFWLGQTLLTESEATAKGYPQGRGLQKARVLVIELQGEPTGITWEGNTYEEVEIADDDGKRTAWVRGSLKNAMVKAMIDAKVNPKDFGKLATGAALYWTRGKNLPKKPGADGAGHTHTAEWIPREKNVNASAALLGDEDPFAIAS